MFLINDLHNNGALDGVCSKIVKVAEKFSILKEEKESKKEGKKWPREQELEGGITNVIGYVNEILDIALAAPLPPTENCSTGKGTYVKTDDNIAAKHCGERSPHDVPPTMNLK